MASIDFEDPRIIDFSAIKRSRESLKIRLLRVSGAILERIIIGDLFDPTDGTGLTIVPQNLRNISDKVRFQIHQVKLTSSNDNLRFLRESRDRGF